MVKRWNKETNMLLNFLENDASRYIAIDKSEFKLYYGVVDTLYRRLHSIMKKVDAYYEKYASTTMYVGSHFDRLRVTKPDEFDIIFAVNLPFSMKEDPSYPELSDMIIEPQEPGYVELRMGECLLDKVLMTSPGDESVLNKTPYNWFDDNSYMLGSKFKDWFKSLVDRALNQFSFVGNKPSFKCNGRTYTVGKTETGPSLQLIVENAESGFLMDIDLVPALKFTEDRWPLDGDYKPIPPIRKKGKKFWVVVPKPNKNDLDDEEAIARCWRLGLQHQERDLIFDKNYLKPAIRLMKKFRDTQDMYEIVSYYIKTIFFWEVSRRGEYNAFWYGPVSKVFKKMLEKLLECLEKGEINYYWNEGMNFIENLDESILEGYRNKIRGLLQALECNDVRTVAEYLLTPAEMEDYLRKK